MSSIQLVVVLTVCCLDKLWDSSTAWCRYSASAAHHSATATPSETRSSSIAMERWLSTGSVKSFSTSGPARAPTPGSSCASGSRYIPGSSCTSGPSSIPGSTWTSTAQSWVRCSFTSVCPGRWTSASDFRWSATDARPT